MTLSWQPWSCWWRRRRARKQLTQKITQALLDPYFQRAEQRREAAWRGVAADVAATLGYEIDKMCLDDITECLRRKVDAADGGEE